MSSALLTASGVTKRFGSKLVLNDASFDVRPGELLGLIGPNGAGKTTLFECLAGLMPMDGGNVSHREMFYVPDGIRPWPDQRVEWALEFVASLWNRPRQIAESLKLEPILRSRIGSLSKGEAKRFLLALGLLTPHPLLLLDEPFDGLDFRQTRDVMALLRTIPAEGRTLFLSIHQLSDAARVCDRLILLSSGRVVGQGTLDQLRVQAGLAEGGLEEIFLALT
ncbi:MAG: ABC transporter ATP-binding protein [Acidobacteriia bacterium]|nr:ABC transporter ATP-binding protein [Terriglobia bacterium]